MIISKKLKKLNKTTENINFIRNYPLTHLVLTKKIVKV